MFKIVRIDKVPVGKEFYFEKKSGALPVKMIHHYGNVSTVEFSNGKFHDFENSKAVFIKVKERKPSPARLSTLRNRELFRFPYKRKWYRLIASASAMAFSYKSIDTGKIYGSTKDREVMREGSKK